MNPSNIPLEIIVEEGATPTVASHIQGSLVCTRQSGGSILLNQEDVATTVTPLKQKYEMNITHSDDQRFLLFTSRCIKGLDCF